MVLLLDALVLLLFWAVRAPDTERDDGNESLV